jgi:hypothetical protein
LPAASAASQEPAVADFFLAVLVWLVYVSILALAMLSARRLTQVKPREPQGDRIHKPQSGAAQRQEEFLCRTSSTSR